MLGNWNKKKALFYFFSIVLALICIYVIYSVNIFDFVLNGNNDNDYNPDDPPDDPPSNNNSNNNGNNNGNNNDDYPPDEPYYVNEFYFNQADEHLLGEAMQYRITFHTNAILRYAWEIEYTVAGGETVFYLLHFANRTEVRTLHLGGESQGLIDFTTFRMNRNIMPMSSSDKVSSSGSIGILEGDVWYLTVVVAHSVDNESFSAVFETENSSMEIEEINRSGNVTLLSGMKGDFNIKKGVFGFNRFISGYKSYSLRGVGFSFGSIKHQFDTAYGGIVCVDVRNHNGVVSLHNTAVGTIENKRSVSSVIVSSDSGDWHLASHHLSIGKKSSILCLIVDMYPHFNHSYSSIH